MADDPTQYAIDVIAHELIAYRLICGKGTLHEVKLRRDLPDSQWPAIRARIEALTESMRPTEGVLQAAIEHLNLGANA
jgi:hypothetical protein